MEYVTERSGTATYMIKGIEVMLLLEILGTIAFSISGAIEAMKKKMDLLGVLVLGLVTAVGGGIIRDLVIGKLPPASFRDPTNATIALVTALAAFLVGAFLSGRKKAVHSMLWNQALLITDAFGLGAFTVLGIQGVQQQTDYHGTAILLFVGVITGVGGGLLRDIFAGNVPYIFRKHVYATASIAGAVAYLVVQSMGYPRVAVLLSLFLVVLLRLLAAHYEWNLPRVELPE